MKRESWFNKCNFGPKSQWKAIQKQQLFKYYSLFIFNLHWRIVLGRTITVYPYRTLSRSLEKLFINKKVVPNSFILVLTTPGIIKAGNILCAFKQYLTEKR